MCTLIIGQNVTGPDSVILAGNRDEDPRRPSREPAVLEKESHIVGGSDAVAGGTWFAIRERRAAVAMLNRWSDAPPPPVPKRRSRGLLAIDLARTIRFSPDLQAGDLSQVIQRDAFAPFNVVCAAPDGSCWKRYENEDDDSPFTAIAPGWHVLTHRDLDDRDEPRTVSLKRALQGWYPAGPIDARARLMELLASHETPRVCIHEGRMVTVSSFVVCLSTRDATYHHVEGRPCENRQTDYSHLLQGRRAEGA